MEKQKPVLKHFHKKQAHINNLRKLKID